MTAKDIAAAGAPCWVDLATSDPQKSQAFYGGLFGWTVEDPGPEYGGYVNFLKDGIQIGGCMRNPGDWGPDVWSVYLASADAEVTVDATVSTGGAVLVPAMPVMDLGTMAVVNDPAGATIGVWQPRAHRGFGVWGEPGTAGWFELHTRDFDESVRFYEDVFGWDTHVVDDSDGFRYTTLGEGEDQRAGVMDASGFLPDGVPSHWSIYWRVEDTDAALSETVGLGGSVVVGATDTPHGRLATASDSTGALFKLVA